MAIQLEDLVARVRLDTSGLDSGIQSASSSISRAGSSMSSAGRKMSLGVTAPLVGIAAAGVNLAASFDTTMRQVAIATNGPTKALSDLAIKMGAETKFSALDASDAMLELAKGGMTAAQIQGGALEATMTAAAAGGISLNDAATLVSNGMQTFGLKASDAESIAVALAGAANASSASMESLQQGLQAVGGVASNAGLSLQETVGALSAFDAAGLKGSDAGTSLKAMLNNLLPATDKQQKAMDDLGLSFVDSAGNFDDLGTIAGKLQEKIGGLSEAQRAQALETIFGSDGMRAATALMQQGAKGIAEYTKAAKDQETTQKLANASMEGLSGSIERAKGSLETAALMIGQVLAPYVEIAAGVIEDLANRFSALPGPVQGIIVAIGGILAVIGPVLIGLGFIATAIGAIGLPVIGVVAGIAALIAILVTAYQTSGVFRAQVQAAFQSAVAFIQGQFIPGVKQIGTAFMGLWAVVRPIVMQIVGVVKEQFPQMKATAQSVFNSIKSIIQSALSIIVSVIKIATGVIKAVWDQVGDQLLSIIGHAFGLITGVIRGGFQIIQGIFKTVSAILKGDWQGAWDGIKQILSGAWTVIKSVVDNGMGILVDTLKAGVQLAWLAIKKLPGLIKQALAGLFGIALAAGEDLVRGIIQGIENLAGAAKDAAVSMVKNAMDAAKDFLHIGSPSKRAADELGVPFAQGFYRGVQTETAKVKGDLRKLLAGLFDGLAREIGPTESQVQQDTEALFTSIEEHYKQRGEAASKRITDHFKKVRNNLEADLKAAKKTKTKADDKEVQADLDALDGKERRRIRRAVDRWSDYGKAAKKAIRGITDALAENARKQDQVNALLEDARAHLEDLKAAAADMASSIQQSFIDFGNVVGLGVREIGEQTVVTTQGVLDDLAARLEKARRFVQVIATLTAAGLNQTTIQQLLAAGVENGLATAEAIAQGGTSAIEQINAMTAEMTSLGTTLGASMAQQFYGNGIAAAQAVVDGLVLGPEGLAALEQQAETLAGQLETAMSGRAKRRGHNAGRAAADGLAEGLVGNGAVNEAGREVAKQLVREFKRQLGIKSPSKVFLGMGQNLGFALASGMDSTRLAVVGSGRRMAAAATTAPSLAGLGLTGKGGQPQVRVFIGERELTDIVSTEVGTTLAPLRVYARQGI